MATTAVPSSIDLTKASTWSVTLGTSITRRAAASSPSYHAVQYNYHAKSKRGTSQQIRLQSTGSDGSCEARLQDGEQEYVFKGVTAAVSDQYVLVLGSDPTAGATLERIAAEHVLNVVKTPGEDDERSLRQKYLQLDIQEESFEHSGDEYMGEDVLRSDNPFDYRNLLDTDIGEDTTLSRPGSSSGIPIVRSRDGGSPHNRTITAANTAPRKKRKAGNEVKPSSSKKAKTTSRTSGATDAQIVPSVRLARRATLRQEDDIGELILEDEDEPNHRTPAAGGRKPHSSMAMALSGQLGPGPISLHSAASSPASPFHSPAPERPGQFDDRDADTIDLGGLSDGQDGGDEQEDGDVDDFELPSPVQDRRRTSSLHANDVTADDEEDDLSKELARAMAEQEDEPSGIHKHQSEEESEEE